MKDVDLITFSSGDYYVISDVVKDNFKYLFLSKKDDMKSNLIKKIKIDEPDVLLPIEDEKEFELAFCLLFEKTQKKDTKKY